MATKLMKPVHREVMIGTERWIVSLLPETPENRFPCVSFKKHKKRWRYTVPVESVRNYAADRTANMAMREKKKMRKERKRLRDEGLL